jgi:hypothetical protein
MIISLHAHNPHHAHLAKTENRAPRVLQGQQDHRVQRVTKEIPA